MLFSPQFSPRGGRSQPRGPEAGPFPPSGSPETDSRVTANFHENMSGACHVTLLPGGPRCWAPSRVPKQGRLGGPKSRGGVMRGVAWHVMERIKPTRHDGVSPLGGPPCPRLGGPPAGPLAHVGGPSPPVYMRTYERGGRCQTHATNFAPCTGVHFPPGIMHLQPRLAWA